ncbi:MAG: PLP-dependent cysteine synthase family protein [Candidatus Thorarchaeota archaeon]
MEIFKDITETIGRTPIVMIEKNLFAKLECFNPGGMKDRPALFMIKEAEKRGDLKPGMIIVESSSGTFARGLAEVAKAKGYTLIIVTDTRMDKMTRNILRAFDVKLEIVIKRLENGGWQQARLNKLYEILKKNNKNAFWPKQYDNIDNPRAYYHSLALELLEQIDGKIDILVAACGSGGSISGSAYTLKQYIPTIQIVAVDSVGSVIFGQPDLPRLMSGMGMSIIPKNLNFNLIDEVHWVSDGEAFYMSRLLAKTTGIFAGGSSGAVYLVAKWLANKYPDKKVVCIFPDRGERYWETIYSDEWLKKNGVYNIKPASEPIEITSKKEVATQWSRCKDPKVFRNNGG